MTFPRAVFSFISSVWQQQADFTTGPPPRDWALVPHSHGYPTVSLASQNATLSFSLSVSLAQTNVAAQRQ